MTPCFHTTTFMLESGNKPLSELPYDIWLNIAAFIPHRDLHRLLSVHRSFFEIALTRKYSHVEWTRLDEVFIHFLNRLQYVAQPGVPPTVVNSHLLSGVLSFHAVYENCTYVLGLLPFC